MAESGHRPGSDVYPHGVIEEFATRHVSQTMAKRMQIRVRGPLDDGDVVAKATARLLEVTEIGRALAVPIRDDVGCRVVRQREEI